MLMPVAIFHVSSTRRAVLECLLGSFGCRRLPTRRRGASSSPWASTLLSAEITAATSTASPSRRWPRAYAANVSLSGAAMFCSSFAWQDSVRLSVCLQ